MQVAREWGSDATLNLDDYPDAAARKEWALELTEGRGPDVVIQCATSDAIPEGLDILRGRGRYLTIGGGDGNISVPANALRDRQIIGVGGSLGRHFYQAVTFLATRQHKFPFENLISGVYTLDGREPGVGGNGGLSRSESGGASERVKATLETPGRQTAIYQVVSRRTVSLR